MNIPRTLNRMKTMINMVTMIIMVIMIIPRIRTGFGRTSLFFSNHLYPKSTAVSYRLQFMGRDDCSAFYFCRTSMVLPRSSLPKDHSSIQLFLIYSLCYAFGRNCVYCHYELIGEEKQFRQFSQIRNSIFCYYQLISEKKQFRQCSSNQKLYKLL